MGFEVKKGPGFNREKGEDVRIHAEASGECADKGRQTSQVDKSLMFTWKISVN